MTDSSITNYDNYIFTQNLNLNLKQQKHNALLIEKYVNKNFISLNNKQNNNNEVWALGNYTQYNYLLYPLKDMSKLYYSIKDMFYSSLQNSKYDEYSIQCWLNIFNKGSYIDWHSHWPAKWESWHGFYCVEVEPDSFTSYKIKKDNLPEHNIDIKSKNNLLVISKSGYDKHKTSEWLEEYPRITVAFDIVPTYNLYLSKKAFELKNHWIPI